MTSKHVFYIWLISVFLAPAFLVVQWWLAYAFYVPMFALASFVLVSSGPKRRNIPIMLVAQAGALLLLSAFYFTEKSTLLNLMALFFFNLMMGLLVLNIPNNFQSLAYVFIRLRLALFFLAVFGLIFSAILAGPLDIDNPIADFLSGDRVRIFSKHYGHSDLISIAIINLIITLSMIKRESFWQKLLWIFSSVVMIYLGRASIGYIGLIFTFAIWFVEHSKLGIKIKNIFYLVAVPALVLGFLTYSNEIINDARSFQVGSQSVRSTYGKDLTAGRSELNAALVHLIEKNEVWGNGVDNKLLKIGITSQGQTVAATESSLRIAAKYGVLYYLIVLMIGMSPFLVLFSDDIRIRVLGISLGAYFLDVFFLNSLFEVPHDWDSLALMLPILLVGEFARKGAAPPPHQRGRV